MITSIKRISFLAFLLFMAMNECFAQTIVPSYEGPVAHQVFINIGLEPEMITTLGYRYLVSKNENETNIYLGGSLKFAPLITSNAAYRINFSQGVDFKVSDGWKGVINNDIYLAHNKNRAGKFNGLGFDLRGSYLYYGSKWTKGIEAGWQYTVLTHITHSTDTKDTFQDIYPNGSIIKGPVDGWYSATASRFRLGFLAGRKLSAHLDFQLGLGCIISVQKQGIIMGFAHGQVPFYLNTQLNYRL